MKKIIKFVIMIILIVPMVVNADVAPYEPDVWEGIKVNDIPIIIGLVLIVIVEAIAIIIQHNKIKKLENELESKKEVLK